ncbi:MAG TPA: hypothetical protein VFP97_06100 [Chitinophagaceae bacterium]|nr:hypothetical protein [Chitinophagaceae bacterium]
MQTIATKKLLLFCISFLFITTRSVSQQSPLDALNKYYNEYPEEKIYLWFNKTAYVAGETIWFKGYVFTGYELSYISSSLHIELYDAQKKLISAKLWPIISGVSEGSIDIDSKLDEGVYFIRAYTTWMLNFNDSFQYIRQLLIHNPGSPNKLSLNKGAWKTAAIPEGGSLVSGLETKVAVRRYSTDFLNTKWDGYLYEEDKPQVKIREFNALDENVALFSFTPEVSKKYLVYVKDELGNYKICPLPPVKTSGVGLSVEDLGDSITYRLRFRGVPDNGNGYQVIAEIQHLPVYHALLRRTAVEIAMSIPTRDLGNGILHVTVLDPAFQVAAERLVFLNRNKLGFDSSVLVQQAISFQPRAQNKLLLKVDSLNWLSYAIAVEDASSSLPPQQENILSALWLSSDLANPIQNAAAYFDHPGKVKFDALDALMISEKWMRYDWDDLINNRYPPLDNLPPRYLSYTGKVTKGKKLKPNEEVNLILYFPDSSTQFLQAMSDSAGNITMDNVLFMNEAKIYYQLNTKKFSAKQIDIDFQRNNQFVPYQPVLPETPFQLVVITPVERPAWLQRAGSAVSMEKEIQGKYKTLQEVVLRAKIETATEKLNEQLSSGLFSSVNEIVFDFINEQQNALGYYNILQWLQGRVAGLSIQFENGEYVPYIRGSQATLYVDEMVADPNLISSVNVTDIAMIKVIKGPFSLMSRGGGGVIAIYTARGNMRPALREPALPGNNIKGYDVVKNFFIPYYDVKSIPQPDSDTRDVLLWQSILAPTVEIDKTRAVFFNNDNSGRYKITIQGINEKGIPVYVEKIIDANQKAF